MEYYIGKQEIGILARVARLEPEPPVINQQIWFDAARITSGIGLLLIRSDGMIYEIIPTAFNVASTEGSESKRFAAITKRQDMGDLAVVRAEIAKFKSLRQ